MTTGHGAFSVFLYAIQMTEESYSSVNEHGVDKAYISNGRGNVSSERKLPSCHAVSFI